MATAYNRYYEQERVRLRQLADEFARRNPALAPLLGSGNAADPDVERLLEGVAFLTALVHQRIDDEFPEFIQELTQMVFPHYLRPLPCMTMVQFESRAPQGEPVLISAGTEVDSIPVDGVKARFRTAYSIDVEPIRLLSVSWETERGKLNRLRLDFAMEDMALAEWTGKRIRLFLADERNNASKLLYLLARHTHEVRVSAAGGETLLLTPDAVVLSGFLESCSVIPYPDHAYPGFRLLQEYFSLPEKFLFVDIVGFDGWRQRGSDGKFTLHIVFDQVPEWAPEVADGSILMNVVPAVNLFTEDAHPIQLDHRQPEYRIAPLNQNDYSQIYSVDEVTGYYSDGRHVDYEPFSGFHEEQASYSLRLRPSTLHRGHECFLSVPYTTGSNPETQTLSSRLTCSQATLPESLKIGDVSEATDSSPQRFVFRNLGQTTRYRIPPLGGSLLWRMISHLTGNYVSISRVEHLHNLLSLYLFNDDQSKGQGETANRHSIDGIEALDVQRERRLVRGLPIEGSRIRLTCRGDHYASIGALFLFGTVLNEFLAGYAALNTFVEFSVTDSVSGKTLTWPTRVGNQRLI